MSTELLGFLLVANLGLVGFVCYLVVTRRPEASDGSQPAIAAMQGQLQGLARILQEGTAHLYEGARAQHGETQRVANEVREAIGRQLTDVAREVASTKQSTQQVFTIAAQLQSLERVLKSQKQRGNLGERSLELILSNLLPAPVYEMQYAFPNGEVVDAVIKVRDGTIPVDAKFPLDAYVRMLDEVDDVRRMQLESAFKNDVKKRIKETAKYIREKDGTLSFALMFIPAEGVYHYLLANEVGATKGTSRNMIEEAMLEKVIIVSPTTFAAYLHAILYGYKAFRIERDAVEIRDNVEKLQRHLRAFEDCHKKLGATLSTTVNHYNAASAEFGKIDRDMLRITGEGGELAVVAVERPQLESLPVAPERFKGVFKNGG